MEKIKIIFLGTPEFAVESLRAMAEHGYDVCAVVTMPDKQAGRGHKMLQSDVKKYALSAGIPVLQPRNLKDPEFQKELASYEADLFVVIAFRMLPEAVWSMPRLGTFNLHASLLPKYRGAAPINRAVMNGETKTGVTTFFLRHDIDTGDIIAQKEIDIAPDENVGSVHDRLMHLGAEMVLETLAAIQSSPDGHVDARPQPEGEFIPAPKIFSADCLIDWKRPARDIYNQIRGLSPYPAARTYIKDSNGKVASLKIFEAKISDSGILPKEAAPGTMDFDRKALYIKCTDATIAVTDLQLQGKKRMSAEAFLLGYHPVPEQNLADITKENENGDS